jgi:hypothetical protein
MTLQQAFEGRNHGEMVGLFLAMLELARQRRLKLAQEQIGGPIHLALRDTESETQPAETADEDTDANPAPPDPRDVDAFDWPDEHTRRRYQRRQDRRARGEKVEEDAELEEDIAELESRQLPDENTNHEDDTEESA